MLFFLFCYNQFYPLGGLTDYHDTYPSYEEARAVGLGFLEDGLADQFEILTLSPEGKLVHADEPF